MHPVIGIDLGTTCSPVGHVAVEKPLAWSLDVPVSNCGGGAGDVVRVHVTAERPAQRAEHSEHEISRSAFRRRVAELLAAVAKALDAMHEQPVVHRDVKPVNLLKSSSGRLRILDFGLARTVAEQTPLGTPAYMAPEQVHTDGGRINQNGNGVCGEAGDRFVGSVTVTNATAVFTQAVTITKGDTTYDGLDLLIDGATVVINGAHLFRSIRLINGAVLTHSANTATQTCRLDWSVEEELFIDGTSRVDVTGLGASRAPEEQPTKDPASLTDARSGAAEGRFGMGKWVPVNRIVRIPVSELRPCTENPRSSASDEELAALAASLRRSRMVTPIATYPEGNGRYRVIVGEARRLAARVSQFCRGVVVMGSTGSGKTAAVGRHLMRWLLQERVGGLVWASKPDETRSALREPLRIAVVGEYSGGKSTLLNTILGVSDGDRLADQKSRTTHGDASLECLPASLRRCGQLVPGVVRPSEGEYCVIDGSRRLMALRLLNGGHRTQALRWFLEWDRYVHSAFFAPTGAGKSVSFVIPLLLTCGDSTVVFDPKGELHAATSRERRRMGHRIAALDPFSVCGGSDGFNPFDLIDPDDPWAFLDECRALAEALVVRSGEEKDPHWNDTAERLIAATLDLLWGSPARAGIRERERASVLSTVNRHMWFLDMPAGTGEPTSATTFGPAEVLSGGRTVLLILPPHRLETQDRRLRLLIASLLRRACRWADEGGRVFFVLDEAAALGHMEAIEVALTQLRGYGVRLMFFYQSLGQLKQCFRGCRSQTLLSNTTQVFFGVSDQETAERVSEMLGKATLVVELPRPSRRIGDGHSAAMLRQGLRELAEAFRLCPHGYRLAEEPGTLGNPTQREMNVLERADLYLRLMRLNGWSQAELASHLCLSQAAVSKLLAVSRLAPDLRTAVRSGSLPTSVAYLIARLPDADQQRELAERFTRGHLSREALGHEVASLLREGRKHAVVSRRRPARPRPAKRERCSSWLAGTIPRPRYASEPGSRRRWSGPPGRTGRIRFCAAALSTGA